MADLLGVTSFGDASNAKSMDRLAKRAGDRPTQRSR